MKTGKEILLLSMVTLCSVSLVGCGKKADKDESGDDLIIEALVGIGPIRFGMSKDEVIEHFGWPDQISGNGTGLNYISSKGVAFTVHAELGMQEIKCWSDNWPTTLPFRVTTFAGSTKEGIGMGATREQIIAAYGQPDRTGTDSKKGIIQNLHYDKLRIKFSLWQGKLIAMILEAPK